MHFSKKSRFKPLFKQIIKLRGNIQNRKKLLNFKKEKWKITIKFYRKKMKRRRNYQKFKLFNQAEYCVTRYANRGTEYKKKSRNNLQIQRSLRLLYGGLPLKVFKNNLKKLSKNKNTGNTRLKFLQLFETRLDNVLYKAKFSNSQRAAGQLILHGKVCVNSNKVRMKSYQIKVGDLISLDLDTKSVKIYEQYSVRSPKWPVPPKNLLINFRTMQILFFNNLEQTTLPALFSFNLRLQKLFTNHI